MPTLTRIKSGINILVYLLGPTIIQIGFLFLLPVIGRMNQQQALDWLRNFVGSMEGMLIIMGVILLLIIFINRRYLSAKLKYSFSVPLKSIGYGVVGLIINYVLLMVFAMILNHLNLEPVQAENQVQVNNLIDNTTIIMTVITIVIVVPFLEELIFRVSFAGLLIKDKVKRNWIPYILMALAFSLIHDHTIITNFGTDAIIKFTSYFIPSMVLAGVYKFSKHNLISTYVMHLLVNLSSVIAVSVINLG